MNDLDELRAVLRARADLAPDLSDVVPATHERVRRRRSQQRTAALAGVVVATVAGLTTASLLRAGPAPSAASLVSPAMPFTVGYVPAGYHMTSWRTEAGRFSEVDYQLGTTPDAISVEQGPNDFAPTQAQPTTVRGRPAKLSPSSINGLMGTGLTWQAGPGRYFLVSVAAGVSESTLRAVADSVATTPVRLPSLLRISPLPPGFTVVSWVSTWSSGRQEEIELCLPTQPYTTGAPLSAEPVDPCFQLDLGTFAPIPVSPVRNGDGLIMNGRFSLSRQLDPSHSLLIMCDVQRATEARALMAAASAG